MLKHLLSIVFITIISVSIAFGQSKEIKGTVTSVEDNSPLPGVSIAVTGTTIGTISLADGTYSFVIPSAAESLTFSYIGMNTIVVEITDSIVNVQLTPRDFGVDEVVITAYGIRKRSSLTGAVTSVENEKLEQIPVGSFENALQGAVAGVNVINSSGMPGSAAAVQIRGIGSYSASSSPLFIMDGIQVNSGDFSSINPNDLQSVTVLKDASATALYGSRGANGVVIITTKKGTTIGPAKITYRGMYGITNPARNKFSDLMNTSEKLDYEEYLGIRTKGTYNRDSLELHNISWFDELTQIGNIQSHEIAAQGGIDKLGYYISGGFYDEKGIIPTSDFKRFSSKINLDAQANSWLKLSTYLTLGYEQSSNAITPDRSTGYTNNVYNPVFRATLERPYTRVYQPDGSYSTPENGLFWANPIEHLELNPSKFNIGKIIGTFVGEIKFSEHLNFKSTSGIDFRDVLQSDYVSPESAWGLETNGSVSRSFSRNYRITNTNLFNYNRSFDLHQITAMIGQESVQNFFEAFSAEGEGLPNSTVDVLASTTTPSDVSGDISEYTMLSFFSTLNYNYNDKYFVDASLRYDGSSRFGANNRWAPFWSSAVMWNLKNEAFLMDIDWINRLKLRASYGSTGNWEIGDYTHLALYGSGPTYNDEAGGAPSAPGNPNLTWEKKNMLNTGFELGLLNNLSMEMDFYRAVTSDMLFNVPYSYTSGFSGGWKNVGKILNQGVELTLDWYVKNSGGLVWKIEANFGYNHNEVLELYNEKEEIIEGETITRVGEPLGTFYMNRLVGVNPANGTYVWLDKDGNPTNEFRSSDQVILTGKSYFAPWNGGFTSSWEYNGFSVSAFFSWMADRWMGNNTRYFSENANFALYNQSRKVLDFWQEPGDITAYPDPLKQGAEFDDHLLENASFLRLKDLTVAYSVPQQAMQKINGLQSMKIYARGRNLLTFSGYSGQDPEVNQAWDVGYYPHVKTVVFGVEIGF